MDVVDLAPRTAGLAPMWALVLLMAAWSVAVALSLRRWSARWPELPGQLLAAGALVAGNVLFFWRPLVSSDHLPRGGGDLNSFFFPLHVYSASRIQDGEFPVWNPYLHGGMSHLGNFQAATLYPPNLISYLLARPYSYGTLEWLAILHYLVASAGAYALGRALGMSRVGSVVAGLVFAYSGFLVAHLGHYTILSAAVWLPWLLLAILRMSTHRSWLWAAGVAVTVFLVASGGHQQTLLYVLVFAGLWWLFCLAVTERLIPSIDADLFEIPGPARPLSGWRSLGAAALRFGLAIGGGLGMAAPMILPSLQVARRSVRSTLSYEQASEFSVQPVALLQLLLPKIFGSNPTDHWGPFSSGEIWGYAGVATLGLALIAVAVRRSPVRLFFAAAALVSILFALGPWAPLHGWAFSFMPLFDLVRAPARAYLFLNLSLALLAGFAVSQISGATPLMRERMRPVLRAALRVSIVVLAAAALVFAPLIYSQILGVDAPSNRPVIAADNLNLFMLYLSLFAGSIWLTRHPRIPGTLAAVTMAALIVMDLFGATASFNPTPEDLVASYREPGVEAFLAERRDAGELFRVETTRPGLQPNFGLPHGVHEAGGLFDPMQPAGYSTVWNVSSAEPSRSLRSMFNVRYVITGPEQSLPDDRFEVVYQSAAGTLVWEDSATLPRSWFVAQTEPAERIEDAIDVALTSGFDPAERVVIVGDSHVGTGSSTGTVHIVDYQPERIEIVVDADGPGYVLLADGDFPGWRATVDGRDAPVLAANGVLRAVSVDGGEQRVVFKFQSTWVRLGWVAGVVSALGVVGMAAFGIYGPHLRSRIGTRSGE